MDPELKKEIYNYLQKKGEATTSEILDNISVNIERRKLYEILDDYSKVNKEVDKWTLEETQKPGFH